MSEAPASPPPRPPAELIARLRAALERAVVGHPRAKTGLLLALAAGEHALLVGPPGSGKTQLAERFLASVARQRAVLAFHRDTRLQEIAGDAVLRRETLPDGERLREESAGGGFARARVWLLDDLGRAPGEVRAAVLRAVAERRLRGSALPLELAVATALPEGIDARGDPLDRDGADRFAVQLAMPGLVTSGRRDDAARLLEEVPVASPAVEPLERTDRDGLRAAARALPLVGEARDALVSALGRLRALAPDESPLSDRTFGRAAPRVMRAHALLRGADRVGRADVRALGFMLAQRIPPGTLELAEALLEELALASTGSAVRGWAAGGTARPGSRVGRPRGDVGAAAHARDQASDVPLAAPAGGPPPARPADVRLLLRALEGELERGHATREEHPGGVPRGWRRMRTLDEVTDADPIDAALLAEARLPALPRVYRRRRAEAGGSLALLRDVSASMEGRLAQGAEQVVHGVIRLCARRRMRVGYLEFHHEALRYDVRGRFFHRRYARLLAQAGRARAVGRTNYEAPLRVALDELGRGGRDGHIVLLTDGIPVLGDPEVRRERARARKLGVRIHTVFLGPGEPPAILERLARETRGLRFVARSTARGGLRVELL